MTGNGWQKTASAFIFGLGVGAGLGVLFAPKSGDETRSDIAGSVKDGVDGVVAQGNKIGRRAQKSIENAKDQFNAVVDAGGAAYKEAKRDSEIAR